MYSNFDYLCIELNIQTDRRQRLPPTIMNYKIAKKQFFEFLKKNYHQRVSAAADVLFYNIEGIAEYEKKSAIKITKEEALNGAKNWLQYSEGGCALVYNDDLKKTYFLDAFDINQYLRIQADLLEKAWHEWELFKYYRNIE